MASEETNNIFPHTVLTLLPTQIPTVAVLQQLQKEVSANVILVPSSRGYGTVGHYTLVVLAAKYILAAQVWFDPPLPPGLAQVHALAVTGAHITVDNRKYLADQKKFIIHSTTKEKIKQQVIQTLSSAYTNSLKAKFIGFANDSTLDILTHFQSDYVKITSDDLDLNMKKLHKEGYPANPIEGLYQ
jgi:hypothetical protein